MLGAVLFDLDGTLVDHEAASRKAVADWSRALSCNLDLHDDARCREWLRLEAKHFSGYLTGALSFDEQRRQRVIGYLSYLGLSRTSGAEVDDHFREYLRRYEGAWTAYPDARPCLDRLMAAGVVTGVLTNGDEGQQQAKLRAVGLSDCFTVVVASSALPQPKPASAAFQSACERLGLNHATCSSFVTTCRPMRWQPRQQACEESGWTVMASVRRGLASARWAASTSSGRGEDVPVCGRRDRRASKRRSPRPGRSRAGRPRRTPEALRPSGTGSCRRKAWTAILNRVPISLTIVLPVTRADGRGAAEWSQPARRP